MPSRLLCKPLAPLIQLILDYNIFVPTTVALIRWKAVDRIYRPVFILLCLGATNEMISDFFRKKFHTNAPSANIYTLFETIIYLWIFSRLGSLKGKKNLTLLLGVLTLVTWLADGLFIDDISKDYFSYSNICHGFMVTLLSISSMNEILLTEKQITTSSMFWVFIGTIVFNTYLIIVEMFWIYGLHSINQFAGSVYSIQSWVDVFCNLIFAMAILWMPRKQAYSLQF